MRTANLGLEKIRGKEDNLGNPGRVGDDCCLACSYGMIILPALSSIPE